MPFCDLAIPFFDYKSHFCIDRRFRLIRKWTTTHAAVSDGARVREGLLDKTNTASTLWSDTAYHSKANEEYMESRALSPMFIGRSRISSLCFGTSNGPMERSR